MLNNCVLIGRLVRDPEARFTPNNLAVTKFTLAVDRSFKNKQGERETDFIDIVTFGKLAETVANHLSKGRLVAVAGRLQIRSYDDRNGVRRKAAEIVADNVRFLDWPKDNGQGGGGREAASPGQGQDFVPDFDGDGIPF